MTQVGHIVSSLLLWRLFSQTIILDCFSVFYNSLIIPVREPPTLYPFLVLSGCWVTLCDIFQGGLVWDHSRKVWRLRGEVFANNKRVFYRKITLGLFCFIINVVLHLKLNLFKFKLVPLFRQYQEL